MKKNLLATFTFCLILICICQTAFAQYPFYFSSGNFNPPNSWNQSDAYRMGVVANTNIQGDTATAVGNCYFRFFSANAGGTIYEPSGNLDSLIPLDTPFVLATNSVINKAYYFQTFNTSDNYIFKTSGSGAPGNTMAAVIRIQGPIQYVTGLTQYPAGDVYPGEAVTVTVTISDTFSVGQGVYLRYSLDNWATSAVIPMTGSGTQYSATIAGTVNVSGAGPNYYVFTSGANLTIPGQYADLMTVNLYNNNFANFTYYVDCPFALSNTTFQMLQTDKARYNPSDIVNLTATFQNSISSGNLIVKYWHLGDSIGQNTYTISNNSSFSWTWQSPSTDYSGYVVQVTLQQGGVNVDSTSIAIDVSSQYNRFPRYGFLSQFSPTDAVYRNNVFQRLNRYHLNALQFYDVNHKHDVPLAGTIGNPDTVWNDIANRENYLSTVLGYIGLAHSSNMKAMNYNLLYGAWTATAAADGVLPTWGLYYNSNHTNQWGYTLPGNWASNLQIENPADTAWQNFLWRNEANLFQAIPYDGWHIDQLGNPGTVYDYNGNSVNVGAAFGPYITAAKSRLNVNLVMNAVTNYGQSGIATSPVDFLYTEVWDPYVTYNDLAGLVASNNTYSSNKLATVFAAYINLGNSGSAGIFNTPGVLLADAVMFSAGASHIELGDHMLDNPYFPNSNLRMSCGLEQNMIQYYDFLTGYENLLRDSVSTSSTTLQTSGGTALATTAALGKIWVQSDQKTNTQIFQLINLVNANTINWRDSFGTQTTPTTINNIPFNFIDTNVIEKLYYASPDFNNGIPTPLSYTRSGDTITFTLPKLQYWTMVVAKNSPHQAPIVRYINAVNDSFSVLQASVDTFNVIANDTILPNGDSACISLLSGSASFTVLNCTQILYRPDSTFTGNDTCRYSLCDTSGICDTATVVVKVNPNPALLPVAGFMQDTVFAYLGFGFGSNLFQCNTGYVAECAAYEIGSTSVNFDSLIWEISSLQTNCVDSPIYYHTDTISFELNNLVGHVWHCFTPKILVCLTAYNKFGSTTYCDTSCIIGICEGINEVPFASFDVFPNPFSDQVNVSIDASTSARVNVSISDDLGRLVYQTGDRQINSGKQTLTLPLTSEAAGIYFWAIEAQSEGSNTPYRLYGKIVKQ